MVNSRDKGKRGELEFSHFLKGYGYEARRGQQFSGGTDSPDVVCASLPIHWEVKLVEALNVDKALEQAVRDCGKNIPVVAHRRSRKAWKVTLRAEDFMKILGEYVKSNSPQASTKDVK